jgi:hypothetical protein
MKYGLIGAEAHTHPYVIELSGDTLEEARVTASNIVREAYGEWETIVDEDGNESYQRQGNLIHYQIWFLIDFQEGQIFRTSYNQKRELELAGDETALAKYFTGTPNVVASSVKVDTPTES